MTAFLAAFSMREMKVVMKEVMKGVMKGVRECGSWLYTSHKCPGHGWRGEGSAKCINLRDALDAGRDISLEEDSFETETHIAR
jgi:hypothetical protein